MDTSLENLYMYVAARQKLTAKAYSVSKDLPSSLIVLGTLTTRTATRTSKKQLV